VVDQAVRAAAAHPDFAHAKAMVNAVLRRFLRQHEALLADAIKQPLAQWNYPQWWIDAARAAYPDQWEAILAAGNVHPPLTLRVNRRKTDVDAYLAQLAARARCGWNRRSTSATSRALPTAWCRCRTPAPSWPRRCSTWPMACACWTPAPPRAARAATSWNWPTST
jgi:16S rRNA C967 or C1407 C5-methylase (RsmB/RsmF family)